MPIINFDTLKAQLLKYELATPSAIEAATQKVICINGLWARDGRLLFDYAGAGWMIEGEPVVVKVREKFPHDENPETIKEHFKDLYPGVRVFIEIT